MDENSDHELPTPAGMHTGISAVMYAEIGETTSRLIDAMFEPKSMVSLQELFLAQKDVTIVPYADGIHPPGKHVNGGGKDPLKKSP